MTTSFRAVRNFLAGLLVASIAAVGLAQQPVTVLSGLISAVQSGVWTFQPGNTPNTSPWLMTINQGGFSANVNSSGQLSTVCANCSGSGVSQQDNTGYTTGTTLFAPGGGIVSSTAVGSGNAGAFQMTTDRNLFVNLNKVGNATLSLNSGRIPVLADINNPGATATVNGIANVAETSDVTVTSESSLPATASTNATNVKASAGKLYGFDVHNETTTKYYLRLYNLATAPTCSSATGFIRSIPIPPASTAGLVGGEVNNFGAPVAYSTGIAFCITGGSSSTDNTNAATGVYVALRFQ